MRRSIYSSPFTTALAHPEILAWRPSPSEPWCGILVYGSINDDGRRDPCYWLAVGWGLTGVAGKRWRARCVVPTPREHPHCLRAVLVATGVVRFPGVPVTVDRHVGRRPPLPLVNRRQLPRATATWPTAARRLTPWTPQSDPEVAVCRLCTFTIFIKVLTLFHTNLSLRPVEDTMKVLALDDQVLLALFLTLRKILAFTLKIIVSLALAIGVWSWS